MITWWDKRLYCRLKIWKFASIFFTDILDFVKIWMTSAGGNAPRKDVWRNMDCGMHLAWRATWRFQILCCHITRINRVPISVIDHGIDSGWLSQSFYSICERFFFFFLVCIFSPNWCPQISKGFVPWLDGFWHFNKVSIYLSIYLSIVLRAFLEVIQFVVSKVIQVCFLFSCTIRLCVEMLPVRWHWRYLQQEQTGK